MRMLPSLINYENEMHVYIYLNKPERSSLHFVSGGGDIHA